MEDQTVEIEPTTVDCEIQEYEEDSGVVSLLMAAGAFVAGVGVTKGVEFVVDKATGTKENPGFLRSWQVKRFEKLGRRLGFLEENKNEDE